MHEITRILERLERGEKEATSDLLPLIYNELRALARSKLEREQPGQTLQATALVHEAYLRLVAPHSPGEDSKRVGATISRWDSRGHFFAAAAEAMRRILIEAARRRDSLKRGGEIHRDDIDLEAIAAPEPDQEILRINAALDGLADVDGQAAEIVKLRYFAGLTVEEAADVMGLSLRSAERLWAYARAWLFRELSNDQD